MVIVPSLPQDEEIKEYSSVVLPDCTGMWLRWGAVLECNQTAPSCCALTGFACAAFCCGLPCELGACPTPVGKPFASMFGNTS